MNGDPSEKTILLVEDNAGDEALTLRALKRANIRNNVVVARDGAEAIDYLFGARKGALPVIVLLDLKLPKVNGHEVLARIRSESRTKLLPVVMLTSSSEQEDVTNAYSGGVNSYIQKPVDFTRFAEVVKELGLYWLVINLSPSQS